MKIFLSVLMVSAVCLAACSRHDPQSSRKDHRLRLSINEDAGSVEFTDRLSGKKAQFRTEEGCEGLLFRNIVSPDGKWVFLPAGLYSGFQFCRSTEIFDVLRKPGLFSTVWWECTPSSLSTFIGWRGESTVVVEIGMSGVVERWEFTLPTGEFVKQSPGNPMFFVPQLKRQKVTGA